MSKKVIMIVWFAVLLITPQANADQEVFGLKFFSSYEKIKASLKADKNTVSDFERRNLEMNGLHSIQIIKNPVFNDLGVEVFTNRLLSIMGNAPNNKYEKLNADFVDAYLQFDDENKFYNIVVVWDKPGVLQQLKAHLKNHFGEPRRDIRYGQEYLVHNYRITLKQIPSVLAYRSGKYISLKGSFTELEVTNTFLEGHLAKQEKYKTWEEGREIQKMLDDFNKAFGGK